MKRLWTLSVIVGIALLPSMAQAEAPFHHELTVSLSPETRHISVTDEITVPEEVGKDGQRILHVSLHSQLDPRVTTPGVTMEPDPEGGANHQPGEATPPLDHYQVILPADQRTFVMQYAGTIAHPQQGGQEYARSFRDSVGIVSPEGAVLGGRTYWYPRVGTELVTFSLDVRVPAGWDVASQGSRTRHRDTTDGDGRRVRWEATTPQQGIFLIAGPWTEYRRKAGAIQTYAFLRHEDQQLASRYLTATDRYLRMYNRLIGPYPYPKFALVENFWETGYGMPSFTLLGPRIIRFPFILHSSYPHEILHNWWGNGVYVEDSAGNWSEGLTAYLADHLIKEQRGEAVEYRRDVLQKYADYVSDAREFPLTAFRMRHDPATEAVGYGKTLMLFHMIRGLVGDHRFREGIQRFYREHRFQHATFEDIEQVFAQVADDDLSQVFDQWVHRTGAPSLRVGPLHTHPADGGYVLSGTLVQDQAGKAYRLRVPVAVHLDGAKKAYQTTVEMVEKRLDFELLVPGRPVRLEVDPQFDLFRTVDRQEVPPALSEAFGAEQVLMVLPSRAARDTREAYRELAATWKRSQPGRLDVQWDDAVEVLPSDRAVWVVGWENRFRDRVAEAVDPYGAAVSQDHARIDGTAYGRDRSLVISTRHPDNPAYALTWLVAGEVEAVPGLARKLPHYRKYSYLAFEGREPQNILKGRWPVTDSPLSRAVVQPNGRTIEAPPASLAPRRALIEMPPAVSAERMLDDVQWLASEALGGRGLGTPELDRAAAYLVERFRAIGLEPAGDEPGSYLQVWEDRVGDPSRSASLTNVIGMIPGSDPDLADAPVIIGAHYDHLGRGWPDVHEANRGKIHPGANDNASGVAVLLEVAHTMMEQRLEPARPVVFIAFTGEEAGLRGSTHYVTSEGHLLAERVMAMVNLDTVGRLDDGTITAFGVESATEWGHIVRGVGHVTGIPIRVGQEDMTGDHTSFHKAGVPALFLFGGAEPGQHHSPQDTIDYIDSEALVQTATVAKEIVTYLADRATPLTNTLDGSKSVKGDQQNSTTGRKVRLGTMPDFAYGGPGVRVDKVFPGSPADKAGLRTGDVILELDRVEIPDLAGLARRLQALQPGDDVVITFQREGAIQRVRTNVTAR